MQSITLYSVISSAILPSLCPFSLSLALKNLLSTSSHSGILALSNFFPHSVFFLSLFLSHGPACISRFCRFSLFLPQFLSSLLTFCHGQSLRGARSCLHQFQFCNLSLPHLFIFLMISLSFSRSLFLPPYFALSLSSTLTISFPTSLFSYLFLPPPPCKPSSTAFHLPLHFTHLVVPISSTSLFPFSHHFRSSSKPVHELSLSLTSSLSIFSLPISLTISLPSSRLLSHLPSFPHFFRVILSRTYFFPSVSLTRSLTPSRCPSLPHFSEPSDLQFRISSSLPASLNLPFLLKLSLPLSLPPFSDFVLSFSNFLRSPQSSIFVFSVFVSSLHF